VSVEIKICGLKTEQDVYAAVTGGAAFVGFVFFPPSPRSLDFDVASRLALTVPSSVKRVALVVNEEVEQIERILDRVEIDVLQLHGKESPDQVQRIKDRFGLPIIKAVPISEKEDLNKARSYAEIADWLLFDSKPPKGANRPGGNAVSFDWELLSGQQWSCPWFLAGGINAANAHIAVKQTGTKLLDVSSGVEEEVAVKSSALIHQFLALAPEL
jgi:phosphoribosylanthranilate isomerase